MRPGGGRGGGARDAAADQEEMRNDPMIGFITKGEEEFIRSQ